MTGTASELLRSGKLFLPFLNGPDDIPGGKNIQKISA